MPWRVVERKIGRAGGEKRRAARQRDWDRTYGADNCALGYVVEGEFVLQEQAGPIPLPRARRHLDRSLFGGR